MLRFILLSLSFSLLTSTFAASPVQHNAAKNTAVVTQNREIADFTGVSSSFAGDVFLVQGDAFSVQVTGPEGLLSDLHTDVKQGVLHIQSTPEVSGMNHVFVTITMPNVERIALNGAGDIVVQSSIKANDLFLSIGGRGDLAITNLEVANLTANITGSGNIRGGIGATDQATLSITGSGDILLAKVNITNCEASIAGSGNIKIGNATTIIASIAGSGDVAHEGNATVSKEIIGNGEVIQL